MDSGSALDNLVNKSVVHRFLGGHEVVAVGIFSDYVNGLAGVLREDGVEGVSGAEDVVGVYLLSLIHIYRGKFHLNP